MNEIRSNISMTEVENGWVINAYLRNPDFVEGKPETGAPTITQQFVATNDAQATDAIAKALKAATKAAK